MLAEELEEGSTTIWRARNGGKGEQAEGGWKGVERGAVQSPRSQHMAPKIDLESPDPSPVRPAPPHQATLHSSASRRARQTLAARSRTHALLLMIESALSIALLLLGITTLLLLRVRLRVLLVIVLRCAAKGSAVASFAEGKRLECSSAGEYCQELEGDDAPWLPCWSCTRVRDERRGGARRAGESRAGAAILERQEPLFLIEGAVAEKTSLGDIQSTTQPALASGRLLQSTSGKGGARRWRSEIDTLKRLVRGM